MRFIFLLMCLAVASTVLGQSQNDRITIDTKNIGLKEFVQEVESQTKYRFVYGEDVKLKTPITISAKEQSIVSVLKKSFSNQGIVFEMSASHIILKKEEESASLPKRRFTVSGYLIDDNSGETLIGASVYNISSGEGTFSNEYGFYSLTIPEGETKLRFSYVGTETRIEDILLQKNMDLNIRMKSDKQLNEIVVYGEKPETGINATQMGAINVPLTVIKSTPALLGEADIMKTIQLLPGVQAGTEGSAGVYVRGGGSDENLILLDGIPLYNVDHLYGFFSVFTPEAIKKVNFFKGSFPARFGGRLSSVIDVRTNDGDMQNYHGTIGIGLLSSKLQLEGPIIKDRTSFNISTRRSYLDLMAKPFMEDDFQFNYYFYDVNAKVNHRFNDRSRLFVNVYHGRDKMGSKFEDGNDDYMTKDDSDLKWGNLLVAAKWNYQLNPKLFSNTTLAYTEYKFNVNNRISNWSLYHKTANDYSSVYVSGIQDLTYNVDFDYRPVPNHHVKFGGGYLYHRFNPEVQTAKVKYKEEGIAIDTTYSGLSNSRIPAHEASLYAEDDFNIGKRVSANVGFHFSLFNVKNKTYASLQPRLSTRFKINNNVALKASYTQMSQYIHLLSNYTITMPSDLWVPATEKIKPMQAHQYSVGTYYTGFRDWELSMEVYYKSLSNVLEYKDGASFIGSSRNWEDKVEMGTGRAMGVEFMVQKTIGKTTGWLSYTLAKSDRKFAEDGINNGQRFPYRYDRRHNINATFSHKFSDKVDIGASWVFYTGGTTTIAEEKTIIIRPEQFYNWYYYPGTSPAGITPVSEANYIENRNNYRLPNSHRLNLGVNFNKKTKRGMRTWNISVYNIYNAMNPTFIYRTVGFDEDAENPFEKPVLKKITILPFIPSVSYTYKF